MKNQKYLIKNIGYMVAAQVMCQIIPIISVPYLIRTIGLEKFGLICFAYAYTRFFVVITNFGFQLSATQIVSKNRENKKKLSEIFFTIMIIKIILFLFSLFIFLITLFMVPTLAINREVFLISFIAILGNVLFPDWFLMGVEAMKQLSLITIFARFTCLIGLIIFVRFEGDYLTAALLQSSVEVVCGLIALGLITFSRRISWNFPSLRSIKGTWVNSWAVFTSQVYVTLFSSAHTFILGCFASSEVVGIFATGEKVIRAVSGLVSPISSAIYPRVCALVNESLDLTCSFLRRILVSGGALFFLFSSLLCLCSDSIVHLISGGAVPEMSLLIKIMSFVPLAIFIDNIYGTQILLALSLKKEFANTILYGGLFSVIASLIFVPIFAAMATAIICVSTQILVMILMMNRVYKRGITLMPWDHSFIGHKWLAWRAITTTSTKQHTLKHVRRHLEGRRLIASAFRILDLDN